MMLGTRSLFAALVVCVAFPVLADSANIPEKKRTKAELYLTAVKASELLTDPSVILLDVRTRPEVAFVGMPTRVDVHIPLMVMPEKAHYDPKGESYPLERNTAFETDFETYAFDRDLTQQTKIVLICRSGSRSAKAANILYDLGYKNVYTIVDGFEGDKAKDGPRKGKRVINGWKNAGLQWSYKISPGQVYPRDRM